MLGRLPFRTVLIGVSAAVLLGASPADADEIEELKAQIKALQERLAKIEAAQKEAEKKTVTAGEKEGRLEAAGERHLGLH